MIVFPNAKINLGLNITERRADGYHNIETVFYPVQIKDALEVIADTELRFASSGISIPGSSANNLCLKAYYLLKQDFDLPPVSIHLYKHIPIGAGMGGGSADAAFFIKVMNDLFELGLDAEAMMGYARQLGADCAFFINNRPVFAYGKGDVFESIELNLSAYHIALVMPPVHVSTVQAYAGVKPQMPAYSLKTLIGSPVAEWKGGMRNDFEESVFVQYPVIGNVKDALYEAGAVYASMSGSGASVFGLFGQKPNLDNLETAGSKVFYGV